MTTTKINPAPLTRTLAEIADEVFDDLARQRKPVPVFAEGYLLALLAERTTDLMTRVDLYDETAGFLVCRLLANLGSWHGETADRVKAELKAALAHNGAKREAQWRAGR